MDVEKAYDKVNRDKMFDVMRRYGVQDGLINLIEKIYQNNQMKFELSDISTSWCECNSGVRQGCPLSPLLFNIYICEIGRILEISTCGFKYRSLDMNEGVYDDKILAGLMYADDICLLANSEHELQSLIDKLGVCAKEYGLRFSEKKSKVVVINGKCQDRSWRLDDRVMKECTSYKYLGMNVIGGEDGRIESIKVRMEAARRVNGMVKFAASRSGSRYLVGREGWKGMVVNKLMFGAGATCWDQNECNKLESFQNDMGRWLWGVDGVKNECIRGETGWSTFLEREAKSKIEWARRIIFEENIMSEIGRASILEIGFKSKWWKRVKFLCKKFMFNDFVNVLCIRLLSVEGLERLQLNTNPIFWKSLIQTQVKRIGKEMWISELRKNDRTREYADWKKEPIADVYVNGSAGAKVRMLTRCGYLPVRNNTMLDWRMEVHTCTCGEIETEDHVLFECDLYSMERIEWLKLWENEGKPNKMKCMKGYEQLSERLESLTLTCMGRIWSKRTKYERQRRINDKNRE